MRLWEKKEKHQHKREGTGKSEGTAERRKGRLDSGHSKVSGGDVGVETRSEQVGGEKGVRGDEVHRLRGDVGASTPHALRAPVRL